MKLKVLVDNNTLIDQYYNGEPGVSYYIETEGKQILFDLGYSDIFMKNAQKLKINLLDINEVVFSHGHNDHTWGLEYLINFYKTQSHRQKTIIAHPLTFTKKWFEGENIGSKIQDKEIGKYFKLVLTKGPHWITEKLVFLGEVERSNEFENKKPLGITEINGIRKDDYLLDDSALAYKSEKGLIIITGCSHSGICNIIEYAKKVCCEI